MIHYFTGKPGNGKSLHMAEIIYDEMKRGKNVIANFEINESYFRKCKPGKIGKFIYISNAEWLNNAYKGSTALYNRTGKYSGAPDNQFSYLDGLRNYAVQFHERNKKGQIKEGQTLLVIDECQELFNTRSWNRKDRLEWASFFRQHRKYGFEVYLISQDDKVIDKQIRSILQFEYEHRALKYYKFFGQLLSLLCGGNIFVSIKRNYSIGRTKDARQSAKFFRGKKKFYNFYDSYATFSQEN